MRGIGGLKKLDKSPPVLRRALSLTECDLVIAAGAGTLIVLVRRTDGRVARPVSLVDVLLGHD